MYPNRAPPPYSDVQAVYHGSGTLGYASGYPVGVAPPAGQASAPTVAAHGAQDRPPREHCFMVESVSSGVVLEIEGSSVDPNARVLASYKTGADNQLWFEDSMTGTIKSRLSLLVMHLNEYNCLVVRPYYPTDPNQLWLRSGDRLQNRQDPSKVLGLATPGAGSNVVASPMVADSRQMWRFVPGSPATNVPVAAPAPAPVWYPSAPAPMPVPAPVPAPVWTPPVQAPAPTPQWTSSNPGPISATKPAAGAASNTGTIPRRYFHIRSAMHGLVLDVFNDQQLPGTKVIMWHRKVTPADNQLWYLDEEDVIRSKLTDFALQEVGNKIVMQPYNKSAAQKWVKDGNRVALKNNPGTCLDITGEKRTEGATLCQWHYKGSANQHWHFDYLPPRYFVIQSAMHQKVLDVEGGVKKAGTRAIMWPMKQPVPANQLWYLDEEGIIRSKLNNYVLQPGPGGAIVLNPYNGQANQKFIIRDKAVVLKGAPGKCLDIHSASRADRATLCLYAYSAAANQNWQFHFWKSNLPQQCASLIKGVVELLNI